MCATYVHRNVCQFSEVGVPQEMRPTWSSEGRVGNGIVPL